MELDTVVIGGGIVGTAIARELQTAGCQVTLIEKSSIAAGCSQANAGWVTPCFAMPLPQPGMLLKSIRWMLDSSSPLHIHPSLDPMLVRWLWRFLMAMNRPQMLRSIDVLVELSKQSLEFYSDLAARTDATQRERLGFERRGLLMVASTDEGLRAAHDELHLMADRGIAGRKLGQDEILAFEPVLRPKIRGGVYFPNEAQIEPREATTAIAREFEKAGGKILSPVEVYDFEVDRGKIAAVLTTSGRIRAKTVVLAAGSWSAALARRLRLGIPILGGKGYSMTIKGARRKPVHPIMIVERKIAITPFADKLRAAGTLELVNQDSSISPRRLDAIRKGTTEFLDLDIPGAASGELPEVHEVWRGLRPCTPDGVPLIGPSRRLQNLFHCSGHQMLGLQSGPGSARLAADLLLGRTPSVDPRPFDPGRFE